MSDIPTSSSFNCADDEAHHYDHFLGPLFFEPWGIEVAGRIDSATVSVALEIAAGTGRVTRHIRKKIMPSAKLIASDINADMLAEAKRKLAHLDIGWQVIDAQDLPFDDNSIDLVVCCFGYMFVPDKHKAFSEAYRVLKPGGTFIFTTWDKLEYNMVSYVSRLVAEKYLKDPLPESYNLAVSMSDKAVIRCQLENVGFSKILNETIEQFSICTTAKETAAGLVEGGFVFKEIRQHYPEWMDEIKIELEKKLSEKYGAEPMIAPMSAVINQAWK
ncbi:class I SAM-dependent methyltransferase [Chryseobacterium sp. D764]|uniref:class I SAM-dependent methyltransferase n=1 Tax=unclassified Chryseobacterium TaxID=2593645 RepID=UPI0015C1C729|nr:MULTISPECIES: class I SAM-dependent methyltransferase [unclassified Chryseobacterium]QXU50770.1 class I SAM-dependent methyltransferase [Chryseobacterium sp. D764]CAD0219767.1 Ubiquinone/menaquinone biosynthesis C-methylase UbiE [Chryseobacterium sp. JV274]